MTQVGDYELTGEPTSGGSLSTVAATRGGQEARLRFADEALSPDAEVLRVFSEDVAKSSRCAHVAIQSPLGGAAAPRLHVATPLQAGESLAELLADETGCKLPPAECVGLALDLAAGLVAAHAEGLVHGGLGLHAVLVDAQGYASIADYGIARAISTLASSQPALMNVAIEALAPEQVSGAETTAATDIFGLGNVLYRALTGKEPFAAPSALGVSMRLKMGALDPLERHNSSIPAPLRALVHRMLTANPSGRPSAAETREALEPLVDTTNAWRGTLKARVSTDEAGVRQPARTVAQNSPLVGMDEIPDFLRPSAQEQSWDPDTSQIQLPPAHQPAGRPSPAPASPNFPPLATGPATTPFAPPSNYSPSNHGAPTPHGPPASVPPPAMANAAPPAVHPAPFAGPPVTPAPVTPAPVMPAAVPPPQDAVVRDYAPTMQQGMPAASAELLAAAFGDELEPGDLHAPATLNAPSDDWNEFEGEPTRMEAGLIDHAAPLSVPKTMVMTDPRAAQPLPPPPGATGPGPMPSMSSPNLPAMRPPPSNLPMVSAEMDAISAPIGKPKKEGGALTALIWVGVGVGAFLLLGGTVALAILLAS